MPELPNEQLRRVCGSRSTNVTAHPRRRQYIALHRPTTPLPTTRTRFKLTNSPAVRIVLVEEQRGFGVDVRAARDRRRDLSTLAIDPAEARAERAADDALLHPAFAFRELAVGGEACELGARSRPARRTVIRLARAQHEAPRIRRARGRPVKLDVVDHVVPLRIERLAHAPAVARQFLDARERELLAVVLQEEE